MHDYGMNGWGFGMGFGWIIPLIFIFGLFYFLRSNNERYDEESASEILDKKYANGEISEEEYKRKKANLKY